MKTDITSNQNVSEDTQTSQSNSLKWDDVVVYNEMSDTPAIKINLVEHIREQMSQLEEMSARRNFVTRELMNYFSKK